VLLIHFLIVRVVYVIQSKPSSTTIVVTGATGNVGRPLVALLSAAGVHVRAVTRDPAAAGLPAEVTWIDTVQAGLTGATGLFLNSRALGADLEEAIGQAKEAGVTRLVALSALNADDDFSRQPSRFRGDRNREVERLAIESGLQWTSLRPAMFASLIADMWGPQLRVGDVVGGPYAAAAFAPIADTDIAAVAAHAFLTDDLTDRRVPLTGPQAFTNAELVAVLGDALGRSLRYREVPPDALRERMLGTGASAEFVDAYIALQAAAAEEPAVVSPDVRDVLGRPATSFATWAADHRAAFTSA
jgi:uncharacterized protein YbjT (DUF2867 family)